MKIPNQLLGSWAGPAMGRGAATSPARVTAQLVTHGRDHPLPAAPMSTGAAVCSRASEILKDLHYHCHIHIFLSSRAGMAPPCLCPHGPPQPTETCHGVGLPCCGFGCLWKVKAEPDAENLHFMGNFSIYFTLALEKKPLKQPQPLLLLVARGV